MTDSEATKKSLEMSEWRRRSSATISADDAEVDSSCYSCCCYQCDFAKSRRRNETERMMAAALFSWDWLDYAIDFVWVWCVVVAESEWSPNKKVI